MGGKLTDDLDSVVVLFSLLDYTVGVGLLGIYEVLATLTFIFMCLWLRIWPL